MSHPSSYSLSEEVANAISHGIGTLLSVAALTLLVTYAVIAQDPVRVISFSIYGASLIILFLASTLYHSFVNESLKKVFKVIDHCAIYILIAGTYTPLMLLTIEGSLGYWMLTVIWLIALLGVAFKIKFGSQYKNLSLFSYLGMGFISLFIIKELYQQLSSGGMTLLVTGGVVYSLGVIFYVLKQVPYTHAIWHMFVLGGASCHFFMMLFYV